MTWQSILGACGLLAVAAGLTGACAGTSTDTDDGSSSDSTTSTGGATGSGGSGGTTSASGGMGGDPGPCGTDCSAINTPQCQVAQCNTSTRQCEVVNDEDGVACDDNLFCTISDSCSAGTCVGGPQNDCGMAPPQCTEVTCDETSQMCSTAPSMDGSMCQDPNDLCLKGSTCSNGLCIGGQQDDCFFFPVPSDCHVATCNPMNGMCEAQVGNQGGACSDVNDLCTVNKICDNMGMCTGGDPKNCSQLTQGCVLGVCDVNTGQCVAQNLMNNDPCDDLNPCTSGETCQNGSCLNGAPVTACTPNDNCCPMGCTVNNDADCATTDLDIGPHSTTYNSGAGTRGYWFTAPVSFTIKELRVPLEVGTGVQNIQVVKFLNGPPPNFSASTTSHQTLFYTNNVSGSNYFVVNIPVLQGDIIGILGARGTSSMANSYGSGNTYNTLIFGQPVGLQRLVYQANVNTTQAGPLSTETGGSYTRIEMRYGP